MKRWWRRITVAVVVVTSITLAYTLLYRWGMMTFAGEQVSLLHSLRIVVESLTTAGFGGDTDYWTTTGMHVIVILMNVTGVLLVFIGLPLFAVPLFRKALQSKPPTSTSLTDHVVICSYSERDEVLREELDSVDVPYVYVDEDPDLVKELVEDDVEAIHGDPAKLSVLRDANVPEARAVVADSSDETNPTIILSAKKLAADVPVVSVAKYEDAAKYHEYAGADDVVTSRQVLGESLAMRATSSLAEELREVIGVDTEIEVTEFLIEEGSDVAGRRLKDVDLFDEQNVNVIAGWFGGKFVVSPHPDTRIKENSILLVAGDHVDLDGLKARKMPTHEDDEPRVIVCGYGTVGHAVEEELEEDGVEVDVIDRVEKEGVDVVGDITDPRTLIEAEVSRARSVVLALDVDKPTIYAALVLQNLAPEVEVVARADSGDNVWKLYNAGADYVLSLPSVTGELLASILIDEKEILTARSEFDFIRTPAPAIAGQTLAEADVRQETGATVVAVERDGSLITELKGTFQLEEDDVLVVAGSDDSLDRLVEYVDGERIEHG